MQGTRKMLKIPISYIRWQDSPAFHPTPVLTRGTIPQSKIPVNNLCE